MANDNLGDRLERDHRTVLGRTLECDLPPSRLDELSAALVKKKCCYMSVPDAEVWRVHMLVELIKVRDSQLALENLNSVEINDLIDHLCVS